MRIAIFIIFITISIPVHADVVCDAKNPVGDFARNSTVTYVMCMLDVELGLLKNSPVEETFACIGEYRRPMKLFLKRQRVNSRETEKLCQL